MSDCWARVVHEGRVPALKDYGNTEELREMKVRIFAI